MSAPSHTPGPWSVEDSHTGDFYIGSGGADEGFTVAEVYGGATAADDARLIAAAPDLLAVARMVSRLSAYAITGSLAEAGIAADAAIRKATGAPQ